MDPKRTDYSLSKPSRTSFSLGLDDYAARTRGAQTATKAVQAQPVQVSTATNQQDVPQTIIVNDQPSPPQQPQNFGQPTTPASNMVDGFSTYVQPQPAAQKPIAKLNFKTFINQLLNGGLHNPGYLAMAASISAIKGFLAQPPSPQPEVQAHAEPTAAEAMEVGKFTVDHLDSVAQTKEVNQAPNTAIELAAASLRHDIKLDSISEPAQKDSRKIAAGEYLKNLSLKAKTNRHKIRAVVAASVACGIILVSGGLMYANSKNLPEGSIAGSTSLYVNQVPSEETVPNQESASAQNDENKLRPNRLKINSLNINAPSVAVGLTRDNAVDVPEKISDAAWFNGSALPGKPGTTFMLGHYAAGYGGVFDNLAKIKEGDIIEVSDQAGDIFKYKVVKKDKQKVVDINMDALLTSSGENRLVIMTCAGSYIAQNYTDRLIVTANPVN